MEGPSLPSQISVFLIGLFYFPNWRCWTLWPVEIGLFFPEREPSDLLLQGGPKTITTGIDVPIFDLASLNKLELLMNDREVVNVQVGTVSTHERKDLYLLYATLALGMRILTSLPWLVLFSGQTWLLPGKILKFTKARVIGAGGEDWFISIVNTITSDNQLNKQKILLIVNTLQ